MRHIRPILVGSLALGSAGYYYFNNEMIKKSYPAKTPLNYNEIRTDIANILEQNGWDGYNNIGPLLVRLGWHSSGTYSKVDKSGGSDGATMRFPKELNDPANAGLSQAHTFLDPIKQKYSVR